MPVLGCDTNTLLARASCFLCLSDTELIAAKLRLREQIYAKAFNKPVRSITTLLSDSVAWSNLSAHQRLAVDVAQIANDAVLATARTTASVSDIKAETACYCAPQTEMLSAIEYLECLTRQT